jgi:hypothetical protein
VFQLKCPVYCIINGKAVKAVRTKSFKLEVLRYCPESDEFKRDMQFLEHIYFPTETKALDSDIVSKKEFDAYVAKLRKAYM